MNQTTGPDPEAIPEIIAPMTSEEIPPTAPPAPPKPIPWGQYMRYLCATNPFYLMSAALLLYGIHRVSADTDAFKAETTQLAFNFGSLQFYEILLIGTAIALARRLIWYDSTLLVGLENALVLVPFMLVTQAALIEQHWVWGFCAAGVALAVVRFGALRRWLRALNLPARALGCGAIVLAINAALPAVFRHLHASKFGTKLAEGAAYAFNEWSWLALLPALIAVANLLPKPRATGEVCAQRRWIPMMFFGFWTAATVTHLYSLGYVYDFDLRHEMVAPGLWALAWTLSFRITDFIEFPKWKLNRALLIAPALAPFVAGLPNSKTTLALAAWNTLGYAIMAVAGTQTRMARNLAIGSVLTMIAATPHGWGGMVVPGFNPAQAVAAAALAGLIIPALLSRNPKLGFLGALAIAVGAGGFVEPASRGANWGVQAGCVFYLLHSLRWTDGLERGLPIVRGIVGATWVLHSYIWLHFGGPDLGLEIAGALVLGAWLAFRRLRWIRGLWVVGIMAGFVAASSPLDAAGRWMVAAPAGLLAVAGSFTLFAIGTATALTKHRWHGVE
jgi:hypothetical protein